MTEKEMVQVLVAELRTALREAMEQRLRAERLASAQQEIKDLRDFIKQVEEEAADERAGRHAAEESTGIAERALAAANAIIASKDVHLIRLVDAVKRGRSAKKRSAIAKALFDIEIAIRDIEKARSAAKVSAMFPEAVDIKI